MEQSFNHLHEIAALWVYPPTPAHKHNFAHEIPGDPNVRLCDCGARRVRYVDQFGNVVYTTQHITVR